MNRVIFSGRLTQDPELRTTSSGKKVCTVSIAVNEGYGDKQTTVFPSIVLWGSRAEYVCKYGKKGAVLEMAGRLQQTSYTDKNGVKKRKEEYVADYCSIIFSSRSESAGNVSDGVPVNSDVPSDDIYGSYDYADSMPDFYGKY